MLEEDLLEASHFRQLHRSLQALASVYQPTLFPDAVVRGDQLARDFDHSASAIRADHGGELSPAQAESLAAIDRKLATMSRDGEEFDLELWSDAALMTSEHWAEVRNLASIALEAFGWHVGRRSPDSAST